jgi:hypothetical protein
MRDWNSDHTVDVEGGCVPHRVTQTLELPGTFCRLKCVCRAEIEQTWYIPSLSSYLWLPSLIDVGASFGYPFATQ